MSDVLWYRPVCDKLHAKIAFWYSNYERGEVAYTAQWLNLDNVVVDRPTRYAHKLPFTTAEFGNLVRILMALEPKHTLTADLTKVYTSMQRRFNDIPLVNRPQLLTSGEWLITLIYWIDDVKWILDLLAEAKSGIARPRTIPEPTKDKDIFEM